MNESLSNTLDSLGLTPEQARIYLSLIDNGPQRARNLSKTAQVQRTYIYPTCRQLVLLGLVKEEKEKKIVRFAALSPDRLMDLLEIRKTKLTNTQQSLEGILPTLKAKHGTSAIKPIMNYYEGLQGIKRIYQDTLKEGKTIFAFLQNQDIHPEMRDWLRSVYLKKRVELNIKAKVILSSGDRSESYLQESQENLRETLVVPAHQYAFQQEVNIYGSKLAFINYTQKELLGIVIENSQIALTMQAFFELTWDNLIKRDQ